MRCDCVCLCPLSDVLYCYDQALKPLQISAPTTLLLGGAPLQHQKVRGRKIRHEKPPSQIGWNLIQLAWICENLKDLSIWSNILVPWEFSPIRTSEVQNRARSWFASIRTGFSGSLNLSNAIKWVPLGLKSRQYNEWPPFLRHTINIDEREANSALGSSVLSFEPLQRDAISQWLASKKLELTRQTYTASAQVREIWARCPSTSTW
jgi:hypothetical protein